MTRFQETSKGMKVPTSKSWGKLLRVQKDKARIQMHRSLISIPAYLYVYIYICIYEKKGGWRVNEGRMGEREIGGTRSELSEMSVFVSAIYVLY